MPSDLTSLTSTVSSPAKISVRRTSDNATNKAKKPKNSQDSSCFSQTASANKSQATNPVPKLGGQSARKVVRNTANKAARKAMQPKNCLDSHNSNKNALHVGSRVVTSSSAFLKTSGDRTDNMSPTQIQAPSTLVTKKTMETTKNASKSEDCPDSFLKPKAPFGKNPTAESSSLVSSNSIEKTIDETVERACLHRNYRDSHYFNEKSKENGSSADTSLAWGTLSKESTEDGSDSTTRNDTQHKDHPDAKSLNKPARCHENDAVSSTLTWSLKKRTRKATRPVNSLDSYSCVW
eukprot:CAMPEP_0172478660 /NCGR_PEP_ID=MMETSP1066-20121228/2740_1 /TAXON_ID=671091 /ORGANISM="Coscinodiscus wailesii, Strain CCMP2513" /LENGTH=291 /DNA_ID=CAMNT_0013238427 /DNA_START=226 /DNA_END=1098 /DNA_ORIENTATION=-